ncbi:hypothetical protein HG535_0B06440 [Zygotorulaspora mrakii]|uniref:Arrestin-like N-terminal domain-containing protein n=1 Tax=Zygotorulaspora mrakii TaxID=42260 RepID=A0A7H9B0V2_ZYGMR|nr:uncharacterized protein HG535_0B06440 [Zygotorulaspora mrakii]QLG71599.1 hypothetical protein HG535_0B06440 [Zygotorulaspora mrakii]
MVAKISIALNPPYNNVYYSSNDTVSGNVSISLKKSVTIKQINVLLKGYTETVTKIDPISLTNPNNMMTPVQDNKSLHNLVSLTKRVFPPDNVWDAIEGSSKPFKVKPGVYEYKFQFPKMPKKPKCLINHTKDLICFTKQEETNIPPSFNNHWKDLTKIDNLDLFYYSYGKVIYTVQVQIELGKSTSWYKPFHRIIREIEPIEFIPEPAELLYDDGEDESERETNGQSTGGGDTSSRNLGLSNNSSEAYLNSIETESIQDYNMSPQMLEQEIAGPSLLSNERYKRYRSTYRMGLPDGVSSMWVEVRSRNMRETYRRDFLFKNGSGKFDRVFLVLKGNIKQICKLNIAPLSIQFNLLETVTYLSQGIANENFSSLRLVEINSLSPKVRSIMMDFAKVRVVSSSSQNGVEGKLECEIKLKDNPILKKLKFNEEDYLHRGNRLYSFKTCSIKRIFNFQLVINWEINGSLRQTENIIKPMQIFVQANDNVQSDILPKYVNPPLYSEGSASMKQ